MNWSHALLVVALAFVLPSIIVGAIAATNYERNIRPNMAARWFSAMFVIATVSGALAAGLWR